MGFSVNNYNKTQLMSQVDNLIESYKKSGIDANKKIESGVLTISIKDAAGHVTEVNIPCPDIDAPEQLSDVDMEALQAQILQINEELEKLPEVLDELAKKIDALPESEEKTTLKNLLVSIYTILALAREMAAEQNKIAHEIKQSNLTLAQKDIRNQGEAQRDAARYGLILNVVFSVAQIGCLALSAYMTSRAAAQQSELSQKVTTSNQDLKLTKAAEDSVAAQKQLDQFASKTGLSEEKLTEFTGEHFTKTNEAQENVNQIEEDITGLKNSLKLKQAGERFFGKGSEIDPNADPKVKIEEIDARINELQRTIDADKHTFETGKSGDRDLSLREKENLENHIKDETNNLTQLKKDKTAYEIEDLKNNIQSKEADLVAAKNELRTATDLDMKDYDAKIEELENQINLKEKELSFIDRHTPVKKSQARQEVDTLKNDLKKLQDMRDYAKSFSLLTKAKVSTKSQLGDDISEARFKFNDENKVVSESKDFKELIAKGRFWETVNQIVGVMRSSLDSITQNIVAQRSSEGTDQQAAQKEHENAHQDAERLIEQSKELNRTFTEVYQRITELESQTNRSIINA